MPPFSWAVPLDRTHKSHTLLSIRVMIESSLGYLDKP